MVVVKVCLWPGGRADQEQVLSIATLTLLGQAVRDEPSLGVRRGERAYRVLLFKGPEFGGPAEATEDVLRRASVLGRGAIWKGGGVRGHFPGPRGAWDLLGGALRGLLVDRIQGYRIFPLDGKEPPGLVPSATRSEGDEPGGSEG